MTRLDVTLVSVDRAAPPAAQFTTRRFLHVGIGNHAVPTAVIAWPFVSAIVRQRQENEMTCPEGCRAELHCSRQTHRLPPPGDVTDLAEPRLRSTSCRFLSGDEMITAICCRKL